MYQSFSLNQPFPDNNQDDHSDSGSKSSTRWRWNPVRDLAMLELIKEVGPTTLRFGRSSGAPTWAPICEGLVNHPSAPNRDVKPTGRTVQTRYTELMDRFRARKLAAEKSNEPFTLSTRSDELLDEFERATLGTAAYAPQLIPASFASAAKSNNQSTDLPTNPPGARSVKRLRDDDDSLLPPLNAAPIHQSTNHPHQQTRHNPYDINNSIFTSPSSTGNKRPKLEPTPPSRSAALNLSVFNPRGPTAAVAHMDSTILQQLVAQNSRLIDMIDANNKSVEIRDQTHAANERKIISLLEGMREDMSHLHEKISDLIERGGTR